MKTLATMRTEIKRLRAQLDRQGAAVNRNAVAKLRDDPAAVMRLAGFTPDPWQADLLRCTDERMLLLCARQAGKSTASAALATLTALTQPESLTLILSPTARQSGELFRKVIRTYRPWRPFVPAVKETALTIDLAN